MYLNYDFLDNFSRINFELIKQFFSWNVVKLKDPFPPARIAGINAFAATQQYYSLAETSARVLPMLCSLMVDPEKPVREQAFKVGKKMITILPIFAKTVITRG